MLIFVPLFRKSGWKVILILISWVKWSSAGSIWYSRCVSIGNWFHNCEFLSSPHETLCGSSRSKQVAFLVASSYSNVVGNSRSKRVAFLVASSYTIVVGFSRKKLVAFLVASMFSRCTQKRVLLFHTIIMSLHSSSLGVIMATGQTVNCPTSSTVCYKSLGEADLCLWWGNGRLLCSRISHHLPRLNKSTVWWGLVSMHT